MKKKIISTLLVCAMTVGMSTTAFATETKPVSLCFNKVYKTVNECTKTPEETFRFSFSNGKIEKGEQDRITVPTLPKVSVTFAESTATMDGLSKPILLGLENVVWPSVGIYTYDISEVEGTTAGVTYDSNVYKMDVLVEFVNGVRKPVQVTFYDEEEPSEKIEAFVNEYSAGSLEVAKEVTGNMGDKKKDFTVKVTFQAPESENVKSTISYVEDGENMSIEAEDWSDGSVTAIIDLKNGEAVTFQNIPYGVTYSVVEDDYTGSDYESAKYTENNGTANDGKGTVATASDCVKITNHKEIGISTGITMDSVPYIMVLCAAVAAFLVFMNRKRISGRNS